MNEEYVIGIDIGGTNIRIGNAGEDGELLDFERLSSKELFSKGNPAQRLGNFIKDYIEKYCARKDIKYIAIGIPATLSSDRSTILQVPNIKGMDNIPMKKELESMLGINVALEKDTNMLYFWDKHVYKIMDQGINIGIYIGTGVGNAIFINGKPLIGKDGAAGELGHIPMIGGTEKCGCGNIACAECYASGWRLVDIKEEYFPEASMSEIFKKHWDTPILKKFVDDIAIVSSSEINILNPETIVFGGGVINMECFPKELLRERLQVHGRKPYPADTLKIMFSEDKVENGVRGAIVFARSLAKKK